MKFKKVVSPGEMLPAWFGVAYRDWQADAAVCVPVPFNLLVAAGRAAWLFLRHGWRSVRLDPRDAFAQGYWLGRTDRDQPPEWRRGGL